jgi:hypothetical protein
MIYGKNTHYKNQQLEISNYPTTTSRRELLNLGGFKSEVQRRIG